MTALYITICLLGITCTWNLYHPPYKQAYRGIAAFIIGVLCGELALFLLPLHLLIVGYFLINDVVNGFWTGLMLFLTFISWCAQLVYIVNSMLSVKPLTQALDQAGIEHLAPNINSEDRSTFWSRILKPFSFRLNNVSCQKGIVYKTVDGQALKLDIYQQKEPLKKTNTEAQPAPVLLYMHGGGLLTYGGTRFGQGLPLLNELASLGWVCVSIDYRLSPRNQWPAHLIDCKTALQWIKQNIQAYGGNPDFVVTAGDSAGGQLSALMALTANDSQFEAKPSPQSPNHDSQNSPHTEKGKSSQVQGAICLSGVMDFCNLYGTSHSSDAGRLWSKSVIKADFHDPANLALFRSANAIATASEHSDPSTIPDCLLIHGTKDSLIAIEESELLAKKLSQVSENKVIFARVPGAQHVFNMLRSIRSELVLAETVRFAQDCHRRHQERP